MRSLWLTRSPPPPAPMAAGPLCAFARWGRDRKRGAGSAFWRPVLRTGAAPQSDGHKGTDPKINKNSPREPGLILTLSRGPGPDLKAAGGDGWAGAAAGAAGRGG